MIGRLRVATAIRLTLSAFRRHDASRFGAALAFYLVFSITPTLLIAISVAGTLVGRARAERVVLASIGGSFGSAAGAAITTMIKAALLWHPGWFATIVGFASLYFGLSGMYRQLDGAVRIIWRDDTFEASAAVPTMRERLASIAAVSAAGLVMLVAIVTDGAITAGAQYAAVHLPGGPPLWRVAQLATAALTLTALFAFVLRRLSRDLVTLREVTLGALLTAILFVLGKFLLSVYLFKAAVGSPFGAAGSIVVVLLWGYWSAQIFFFGLEFTHIYAEQSGVAADHRFPRRK